MPTTLVHLLDPEGRIRSASTALRSFPVKDYPSAGSLRAGLECAPAPRLAFADVCTGRAAPGEILPCGDGELDLVLLILTRDEATGCRWLQAGACDFVVFPDRLGELDTRFARAVRLSERLGALLGSGVRRDLDRDTLHSIRNPLNAIFGYVQLLLFDPAVRSSPAAGDLERVLENARLIEEICEGRGRSEVLATKTGEHKQ